MMTQSPPAADPFSPLTEPKKLLTLEEWPLSQKAKKSKPHTVEKRSPRQQ